MEQTNRELSYSKSEQHARVVCCVLQLFRKRKDKFPMHLEQTYMRYMTFVIESAIQNMKNGQEQWIWVLDLAVYSSSNAPHMSVTLGVLQVRGLLISLPLIGAIQQDSLTRQL